MKTRISNDPKQQTGITITRTATGWATQISSRGAEETFYMLCSAVLTLQELATSLNDEWTLKVTEDLLAVFRRHDIPVLTEDQPPAQQ